LEQIGLAPDVALMVLTSRRHVTLACLCAALVCARPSVDAPLKAIPATPTSSPKPAIAKHSKTVSTTLVSKTLSTSAKASTRPIVASVLALTSLPHLSEAVGTSSASKRAIPSGRRRPGSKAKLTKAPAIAEDAPKMPAAMSQNSTTKRTKTVPGSKGKEPESKEELSDAPFPIKSAPEMDAAPSSRSSTKKLPSGDHSSNMTLRAKIVDSVLVLGGVGAAAAVAGGVAIAVIHKKAELRANAKANPLFLASQSHFGSGAPPHNAGRAFTSTSAALTPRPVVHDASANAIQMFPVMREAHSVQTGNAQPLGLQIHSHRDSDFQLNFPQPAWILVVCLGVIGGGLLVAGILQLICCGRRQKSSRVWSRIADDSERETAEAGRQVQATVSEESADPEVPLLPPLPPLLARPVQMMSFPAVASVPTMSFASIGSVPTMSFASTGSVPTMSFKVVPTRYAAGATQLPQSFH